MEHDPVRHEEFLFKNGVLNENDEILAAEDYKKKINIKSNSINQTVGLLSGGNQQKGGSRQVDADTAGCADS